MPYPRIFRRLFANEGAGPLLRKDIIPCGTTAETVCQGDDSRLTGAVTDIAAMKANIATLETIRKSWIGVPRWWRSTTLPANHVWADGSLVLFEDWPELEEVYNAGGFDGMLLEAGVDAETIAVNLGKWVKHPNGLGLYTPQLGNQFFRAWTGSVGSAGTHHDAGLPEISGSFGVRGTMIIDNSIIEANGAFRITETSYNVNYASFQVSSNLSSQGCTFYASRNNVIYGSSPTVMPASVNLPAILYLGEQS